MIKTLRPADLKAEEPVWEGKWKNLYFLTNGNSYEGVAIYNSQDEAFIGKSYPFCHPTNLYIQVLGGPFHAEYWPSGMKAIFDRDISHTIQIPWKEKD